MLQTPLRSIPKDPSTLKPHQEPYFGHESAIDILARIWPEFDPAGHGIMADMMEKVLRRVEQEQGTSLLDASGWVQLGDYIARVGGTIVGQKDLGELLGLLQGSSKESTQTRDTLQSQDNFTYPSDVVFSDQQPPPPMPSSPPAYQPPVPSHRSHQMLRPRVGPIRKISLGESSQFRPRQSRTALDIAADESEESESHLSSPGRDHRADSGSSSTSSPFQVQGDFKEWRRPALGSTAYTAETEFEGYGLDAEPEPLDNEVNAESLQNAYHSLQRKLRETELEYEVRSNEQTKEDLQNQQLIEDLKRDLKSKRRELSELKSTEQFQSSQIGELEKQIEKSEKTSSTQKSSAATLKKQRDELEEENTRMQESLRIKEEALNSAIIRLTTIEADQRRINADQETMEELRERLATEISKNEKMAWQLELVNSEKMRLKSEVENLGGGQSETAPGLEGSTDAEGRTLMSELANADSKFGPGVERDVVSPDPNAQPSPRSSAQWTPGHEDARRLIQESTSFKMKLKRSSMRDIGQRFKDGVAENSSKVTPRELTSYTQATVDQEQDAHQDSAIVKHRVDDVDCALPLELQTLETKETLLSQALGAQTGLIDDLLKTKELTDQIGVTFSRDGGIPQDTLLANRQQRDRARRRKLQQSRVLSPAEVVDLLNPGASPSSRSPPRNFNSASSKAIHKKESKNVIANVTLVSMYTIVVYLFGVITSVFFAGNGQVGMDYGRFLSFDALQEADMNGSPGRFKVVEILVYWLQNLVWQGDAGFVPT